MKKLKLLTASLLLLLTAGAGAQTQVAPTFTGGTAKTATVTFGGQTFSSYRYFSGGGSATSNNAKITVTGACTITLYATGGDNSTTSRNFTVTDGASYTESKANNKSAGVEYTYTGTGGTITIYGNSGAGSIYGVFVTYAGPAKSNNANLHSLAVSGNGAVVLTPAFSPNITQYTATVPNRYTDAFLYNIKEDAKAVVTGDTNSKNLQVGENTLSLTVTAEDGKTTKTYTVVVTREALQERAETVHLTEAGTLMSYIKANIGNNQNLVDYPITKLTITGNIDARDINALTHNTEAFGYLKELDLSEANIVAFDGTGFSPLAPPMSNLNNELPSYSFSNFRMPLTSIALPKTLKTIGNNVLASGMSGSTEPPVTSIIIPEGVTSIGENFASHHTGDYKSKLKFISLPSTLTSLGSNSFSQCNMIEAVINFNPTPIDISGDFNPKIPSFYGKPNFTLYVPYGSKTAYENAPVWKDFNIIELPPLTETTEMPTADGALIEWQSYEHATGYRLAIYADAAHTDTLRILEFDAAGQLVKETKLRSASTSFSYTVTGLNSGVEYFYTLETLGVNEVVLENQSGNFTTLGATTGINNTTIEKTIVGYYNIMGAKLKYEPQSGVYIILYNNGTTEKRIK